MANTHHITKHQARQLIRLCGTKGTGYLVLASGFDGLLPIAASSPRTGRAIVRALRELAAGGPANYFPRSRRD